MNTKRLPLFIGLGLLVILFFWMMSAYNGMVTASNEVDNKWSVVQDAYQRRKDLIPNLVGTVKGAAKFEKDTYTGIAEARSGIPQSQPQQQVPLDQTQAYKDANKATTDAANFKPEANDLDQATLDKYAALQANAKTQVDNLFKFTFEAYPSLKATENFTKLQDQLEGTENRIKVERDNFNGVVKDYNNRVQRFPGNIMAGLFGFKKRAFFAADPGAEKAPEVSFE